VNLISIVLAIFVGGLQLGETQDEDATAYEAISGGYACITVDKVIKPSSTWPVLKTEVKYEKKTPFLEITVHNPLNKKTPQSVDARFVLTVDASSPAATQKYNLITAVYYNNKANVTFKRIYSVHEVVVRKKIKRFPMQTPCFAREVMPVIRLGPTEVKPNTK